MTGKGWTTQMAAAAGAAAGTGAAQLGLGYGLGVVVWPDTPTPDDSVWLGSLGWATWIAASATVFGAVIAARLRGAQAPRLGGLWRFALAASAAVGALLTVVLVAVPARSAVRTEPYAPEVIAGGYALIGIVLGLVIAYWAVVSRAVAANLILTAGYLWTLAVAGIVVELTLHRESATYLTSWQFAELGTETRFGTIYWPSALLTLLAALLIGIIAAWPSVRRGNLGVGAASSGVVGPLLVAAAFLVLAPQLTGALGQLESAYLIAPYAVLAGLAGSALVVASGQRSVERRAARIARIHRPAPPAATGKAAVRANPGGAELDTPPTGTPQVSAATLTQRSGRAKSSAGARSVSPAQASAEARTPTRAQTSTASPATASPAGTSSTGTSSTGTPSTASSTGALQSAGTEDLATEPSDRAGLWGRLRRGGRAKPSAAVGPAEVITTSDPTPPLSTTSRSGEPPSGTSRSGPSQSGPSITGAAPASIGGSAARASSPGSTSPRASTPGAPPTQDRPASRAAGPALADPKSQPKTSTGSTVAAPPAAPPIAKINSPRDTAPDPGPKPARPSGKSPPPKAAPSRATPAQPRPQPAPKSIKPD